MKKRSGKKGMKTLPESAAIGLGTALVLLMAGLMLTAAMVSKGNLKEEQLGYGVMFSLITASFCGSWTAQKEAGNRRLVAAGITGITILLFLMCVAALFFGGDYSGIGAASVLIIGGSLLAALLPKRAKNKRSFADER